MNINPAQTFNEKVSLIYEYNQNSPLLFREANNRLEKNKPEECINIILQGLKIYPENPVGFILLGRAYGRLGEFAKAKEKLIYAGKLIGSTKTSDFYIAELERIRKNFVSFENSRGGIFTIIQDEAKIHNHNQNESGSANKDKKNDFEVDLGKIANDIISVKLSTESETIQKPLPGNNENFSDKMIISETMAKIFIQQKQFNEARKIYMKLIEKDPARELYYREKIEEITRYSNP